MARVENVSGKNRRFIIGYVLLVGLPVLALVAVLNRGRDLTAPTSVGGVWKFEIAPDRPSNSACGESLSLLSDSLISISQSGKSLSLTLDNGSRAAVSALIEGDMISGLLPASVNGAEETGCENRILTLTATVTGSADARKMVGELSLSGCESCEPVGFHAARQVRAPAK